MREDWVTAKYKDFLDYIQPTKYLVKNTNYHDSYKTPVLTAGKTFILGYTKEEDGIFDDIPVIIFDDFTTASKYVNFKFKAKSSAMKILKPTSNLVNLKFIYYSMQINQLNTDTHKRYWISIYTEQNLAIPHLLEQKAIVSKIEQLFSELDNGIQNLKTAQQKLKIYRQAVLKKAFENIPQTNFNDIICNSQNGLSKRSAKDGKFYKVLRLADIKKFKIQEQTPRKIQLNDKEIEKYKLQLNDLICTRVNGSIDLVGTFILYQNDTDWAFCDHFIRFKLDQKKTNSKFYYYFLQTREVRKFIHDNMVSSAGQNTVSQVTIKSIKIPICSLEEQTQIVQEIESRLSVCDNIEATITDALKKAEALRQSILKKAFEGKLLTAKELDKIKKNPEYESAEKLLERIKKEKVNG